MRYYWLNNKSQKNLTSGAQNESENRTYSGRKKLVIFFCGWSFDNKPFERLDCGDYDVLMFYDYKNHDIPIEIPEYDEYYLVTWSMGVYIAYLLRDKLPDFKQKIAINGTPFPIHNEWGIPVRTFDLTLKYVDTGLQGKFQRNLFKAEEDYEKYTKSPVEREIPEQAEELRALKEFISSAKISYEKFYDRAIISDTDKIVPTKNQINCWQERASIVMLNSGHFPFYSFNSWDDILKCS